MLAFTRPKLKLVSKSVSARDRLRQQLWDDYGSELLLAVMDAYAASSDEASKAALMSALESKDAHALLDLFPWQFKGETVLNHEAIPVVRDIFENAAIQEAKDLGFGFSITRREVANWLAEESTSLIRTMTGFQYETMQMIIRRGVEEGLSTSKIADLILEGDVVWLDPSSANAVMNFIRRQRESGVRASLIDQRAKEYADRLLKQRATTIARTETSRAMTTGIMEAFRQGMTTGEIPRTAMVEWVVDGNPCDVCLALDGKRVALGMPFTTPKGLVYGPPQHPNCECSVILVDL